MADEELRKEGEFDGDKDKLKTIIFFVVCNAQ